MSGILWRWSWRDLRGRWLQVLATALILSFGIGTFAGLVGIREWREAATDQSLAAMRAHDLRVDLAEGEFAAAGQLRGALASLPDGTLAAAEERLVAGSQLDVARPQGSVIVPARLVGIPLRPGGEAVDRLAVSEGRGLAPRDSGQPVAVLDSNFGTRYDLPSSGHLRLAGLGTIPYVGQGLTPQFLLVVDEAGLPGGEASLGVVYLPLTEAQRAAGRPGQVNQLLLRLEPGADLAAAERQVEEALAAALPGRGAVVSRGAEDPARAIFYDDARNDQRVFVILAALVFAGAAFGAFNLISRVVEAQRREIGIGMAIGAEPRLLALRPLLLGLQVAVLGILLGLPFGLLASDGFKSIYEDFYALPVYPDLVPVEFFALAAVIGLLLPPLAAALPVLRAVGVAPVEAIQTGARSAKGGGAALLRRLHVPGRSVAQLPVRNLARGLRRTVLTVFGLAAAITIMVTSFALFDGFEGILDRQEAEVLRSSPDRLEVSLDSPQPLGGPAQRRVEALPGVEAVEPGLLVRGRVREQGEAIDLALSVLDAEAAIWRPEVEEGRLTGGVLLARRAADDLGVGVGDTVTLRHPRRAGGGFEIVETPVTVSGIHGNPVRAYAYLDRGQAAALGMGGIANSLTVLPAGAAGPGAIQRQLFGAPGIASVRPAKASVEALRDTLESFSSIFAIIAAVTFGMGVLVAFTSTSVSVDEHRREYATMFAFGLPPRSGLRVAITESLVAGAFGTLLGLVLGLGVAAWMIDALIADTIPDVAMQLQLSTASLVITVGVGIVAVSVAPLFTYRRMRGMDIPSTLRVME